MKNGFTLIELMCVTAIVGILAAIAMPAYSEYVDRSRRVVAQGQMLEEAHHLERHFMSNGSYSEATLQATTSPPSGTGYYQLRLAEQDADTFKIEATPIGSQTRDSCGVMTVDQAGRRTPDNCWK